MASHAFICGLAGTDLSQDERTFLREAHPWGVILFARNIESPPQIRKLCAAIREALERDDAPMLIDQEGGRVQRIGPPHLRAYPPGSAYGALYRRNPLAGTEAAFLGARLIGLDLAALGISVDCMPVLDIPIAGGTAAIGDRALGIDVDSVATLGGAQIDGLLAGGVLPVIKHMPGHGRALVDSHADLPQVDATMAELEAQDFTPFRLLAKRAPLGMTAHVVFLDVDDSAPATLSSVVIVNIIRERIGFRRSVDDGRHLHGRDLGHAARAAPSAPSRRAAISCSIATANLDEMLEIAAGVPELAGDGLRRTDRGAHVPPRGGERGARGARKPLRRAVQREGGMNDRASEFDETAFEENIQSEDDRLVVDVDGFEGPLDLLLQLARDQKVDLAKISILALAEQYLSFIEAARQLRLEIAADYLVMAAWLAYLKSRLLLPAEDEDEEPSGAELAEALARRLRHLEAIREAGRRLMASSRLGIEVFPRGAPEPLSVNTRMVWTGQLFDLLSAYASLRLRGITTHVRLGERTVFSLQEARERLIRMIGASVEWAPLDSYLVEYLVRAGAALHSACERLLGEPGAGARRQGRASKQNAHFTPLYLRGRREASEVPLKEAANG